MRAWCSNANRLVFQPFAGYRLDWRQCSFYTLLGTSAMRLRDDTLTHRSFASCLAEGIAGIAVPKPYKERDSDEGRTAWPDMKSLSLALPDFSAQAWQKRRRSPGQWRIGRSICRYSSSHRSSWLEELNNGPCKRWRGWSLLNRLKKQIPRGLNNTHAAQTDASRGPGSRPRNDRKK